jgi:esterase/lipase superfamily enzyme
MASGIYSSQRGQVIRVGLADVAPAADGVTWADARKASILKSRPVGFPIKVNDIEEFGVLPSSIHAFSDIDETGRREAAIAEERFVQQVNRELAKSQRKSIFLYIHGYKTSFENPILTSAELWHFLGNEGSFIAYSWPATPKALAYFADAETAQTSARNLRKFLRFLAEKTNAENINIIAYSAGNRVLSRALGDLALEERETSESSIRKKLKLRTVALMASDVDRGVFGGFLTDGLLKLVDQLIIYQSDADWALRLSRFLTNSARVGQSIDPDEIKPVVLRYLQENPKLAIIDVSDAESARKGNGHSYLVGSPWVSSDMLIALASNKGPLERGLVRKEGNAPVCVFPPDYIARLRAALIKLDPNLAR